MEGELSETGLDSKNRGCISWMLVENLGHRRSVDVDMVQLDEERVGLSEFF